MQVLIFELPFTQDWVMLVQMMGQLSSDDTQKYLYDNPDKVLAAVHFDVSNTTDDINGFVLQFNSTVRSVTSIH